MADVEYATRARDRHRGNLRCGGGGAIACAGAWVPPAHYGYFGPAGTFAHQALLTLPAIGAEPIPYATVGLGLEAVRDGEVTAVLVPIENSVEGGVRRRWTTSPMATRW